MKFVKKNKNIFIVILIILAVLIITGVSLFIFLFSGYKNSKYGNRLDGIENVIISDEKTNEVKEILKSAEGVKDVTYNLSGKTCNFIVIVNEGTKPDNIKKIAPSILEKYSKEEKEFYDFQIFIDDGKEKSDLYPVIGYKYNKNEAFTWVGKVVSDEK